MNIALIIGILKLHLQWRKVCLCSTVVSDRGEFMYYTGGEYCDDEIKRIFFFIKDEFYKKIVDAECSDGRVSITIYYND